MTLKIAPQGGTPREVSTAIGQLIDGKINSVGSFTLAAAGATSTTVSDPRVGSTSVVLLIPQTADAAAALAATYIDPVNYVRNASFTVTHAANVLTTKTFSYAILG